MMTAAAGFFWLCSVFLLFSGLSHTSHTDPVFAPAFVLTMLWVIVGPVLLLRLYRWEGRA